MVRGMEHHCVDSNVDDGESYTHMLKESHHDGTSHRTSLFWWYDNV